MSEIRIPDGNAFKLRIAGQLRNGEYTETADFSVVRNMIVNFVRRGREAKSHTIDGSGRIVVPCDGNLALGKYGVELSGYYNGGPWRFFAKDLFDIVDENEDRTEPTSVGAVPVYDVTVEVNFGGDGVTAAFVEAVITAHNNDIESHSDMRSDLAGKVDDVLVDGESVVETDPVTGKRTVGFRKDQFGKVDDVKVNGRSVLDNNNEANIVVPTTVEELNDSADYAKKTDLQTMQDEVEGQIPGKVSDLQNDSQFQTASEVDEKVAAAAVNEVNVSVDGTSGNPSVTKTYANGVLGMAFSGLKGEKGDKLTWDDLTPEQKASLQGKQGATGVYDATTQNFLTTLESTIGSSQTKTMTQGSITEEVLPIKDAPAMRVPGIPGEIYGYLNNNGAFVTGTTTNFKITDYVMLEEGQTKLHIVSGVWKPSSFSQVCFYSQPSEEHFVDKINEGTANTERTNVDYDIPPTARYCRFTVKPDVDAIITVKGSLVKRLEDTENDIVDIQSDIAEVKLSQLENTLTMQKAAQMLDINIMATPCAEGKEDTLLSYSTANGHQEKTVSGKGITDFIPVTGGSSILLISGFYQGAGTGYRLAEFYTEASMGNEIDTGYRSTTTGDISNMTLAVPEGAAYVRLGLASKDTAGMLQIGEPSDIAVLKDAVDGMMASKFEVAAQIRNNPLPIKAPTEELNILFIGSSYSVDTITALHDICVSVGLNVNTGNFYKSGAKISEYLEMIESGEDTIRTYYFNRGNTERDRDGESKSVTACVRNQGILTKNWDIIIIDDDKGRSPQYSAEKNEDLAKFVEWLKMNATNPRVVLALNSTWVFKANMDKQEDSFRLVMKNMRYTGIDVVIPSGAAICNLRKTAVNDGNDIYRVEPTILHLDLGVGRFTAACAAYYALVYPVFGVPLDQCNCTGYWDGQGNVNIEGYPTTILVTDENRATCIECAKKANANRFLL